MAYNDMTPMRFREQDHSLENRKARGDNVDGRSAAAAFEIMHLHTLCDLDIDLEDSDVVALACLIAKP